MLGKIFRFLLRALPQFEIAKVVDGKREVYLRRYFIFRSRWPGSIYLHEIMASDQDRHLHDHPWSFWSFILRGGYTEQLPGSESGAAPFTSVSWRGFDAPALVRHKATDLHRLYLTPGETTWTLVFTGPVRRVWGFQTEQGWKPWREYLGIPADQAQTSLLSHEEI